MKTKVKTVHKKDRIRVTVVFVLFSAIVLTYYFDGKGNFTRSIVIVAAATWLFTMWYLRTKFKEKE